MGTTAARKAGTILQNTLSCLAFELLTACQAIDIRRNQKSYGHGLSPAGEAVFNRVRKDVEFMEIDREIDREIWPDIEAVEKIVRSGELLEIVHKLVPDFE